MSYERIVNGIPVRPDVRKLEEKYGVPKEGQLITYADVAAEIKAEPGSDRFKTVTASWRKRLRTEHNVELDPVGNATGFVALAPSERIEKSVRNYGQANRKQRRAGVLAALTDRDRLTPDQQRVQDHIRHLEADRILAAATAAKKFSWADMMKALTHKADPYPV